VKHAPAMTQVVVVPEDGTLADTLGHRRGHENYIAEARKFLEERG